MKYVAWFLGALILTPIVLMGGAFVHNKMIGPVGWAKEDALKALSQAMKDPDSTVIRSYYVVEKPSDSGGTDIYICGIVDGRNGFGAYTGGTRFVSWSSSFHDTFSTISTNIEDDEQRDQAHNLHMLSAFETVYWNGSCVDSTHPAIEAP